jgi:hypothetical protein
MDTSERERAEILAAGGGDAEVARIVLLTLEVYREREAR